MTCKKDPQDRCRCLKHKHGDCAECEKKSIKAVNRSGRNLNDIIKIVKETGECINDLYITVDGFDGDPLSFAFRSAIDILRGICKYCMNTNSDLCDDCMWSNATDGEDHWMFDEKEEDEDDST